MATDLGIEAEAPADEDASDFALSSGDFVVLSGISWKMYRKLRKIPENYNLRMTYDQGELEIMSPSPRHEKIATLLGSLIEEWAIRHDVEIVPCRTMTIRRADLNRGFEPDNCFYVQHELQMRDKDKINFKVDPPPDLAVEVEVSRTLAKKMKIYEDFRVPELWRWGGKSLTIFELSGDGNYVPRDKSICFPKLPIAKIEEVVRRLGTVGYITLVRSFRDWIRDDVPG
jgi:Uma2 family endonuclease